MGNLVVGSRSGGTVNRYAPVDFDSFREHIQHDVLPKAYCCPKTCYRYYDLRPSDDGKNYRPPPPGIIQSHTINSRLLGVKCTSIGNCSIIQVHKIIQLNEE